MRDLSILERKRANRHRLKALREPNKSHDDCRELHESEQKKEEVVKEVLEGIIELEENKRRGEVRWHVSGIRRAGGVRWE